MAALRKPALLVVDDDIDLARAESELLVDRGFVVTIAPSAEAAREFIKKNFFDLLILDQRMGGISGSEFLEECRSRYPGIAAIFVSGYRDVRSVVNAFRAGAADFLMKPVRSEELIAAVDHVLERSRRERDDRNARFARRRDRINPPLIGASEVWRNVLELIERVAATDSPVLLLGETGTGKELLGRAIHDRSQRAPEPFVPFNPAAVAQTLVESTLFGYRRGAFTGAVDDHPGIFEAAGGGTVFLDEIGEMDPTLQASLLRVLQERKVVRLGDVTEMPIEARVVAATNRDLRRAIQAGAFRQDLFYRLSVFTIEVPPLRARRTDIPILARYFLETESRRIGRSIQDLDSSVVNALVGYDWPGNVRELKNVIHNAIIRAPGDVIRRELLVLGETSCRPEQQPDLLPWRDAELRFERDYFTRLLDHCGGNRSRAAGVAQINRTVLYEHLRKLGLDVR